MQQSTCSKVLCVIAAAAAFLFSFSPQTAAAEPEIGLVYAAETSAAE